MPQHALLSPSSSHIWLRCPPSARLSATFEDKGSEYARQGTDAHTLCQHMVEKTLGIPTEDPRESLTYYDAEMEEYATDYAAFVMETLAEVRKTCKDPVVFIEQKVDFSRYVPEGHGYADCIIAGDGTLHVIDYKSGALVILSTCNSQLMCYALGALELVGNLYDIEEISLTIFQPRRQNVSTYTLSKDELLAWADGVLAPAAGLAFDGKGEFSAGSHCQFCKAKAVCRKRAEYNLELARLDFEPPATLNDDEIAAILTRIDELSSWANDVKDYALKQVLAGKEYQGFKLVEGRSVRKYTDEPAVAAAVTAAGYEPYEKKLIGITAMTSLLGRKRFNEILGSLVFKAPGKPTLVPVSDKRPAMNNAADDFNDN